MKATVLKYKLEMIGGAMGAVAGLSYWHFVGCASGTCAITSNPYISTLYGALMGGILISTFKKPNTSKNQTNGEH